MKKPDPSQPYVQPHWPHIVMISMFSIFAAEMLVLGIFQAVDGDLPGALVFGLFCAGCAGFALLFWLAMYPRFTVTAEGIEFLHRRRGWRAVAPWSNFTHVYVMTGAKTNHIMLADRLMDKPAQYAALKACRVRPERPASPDGCLVLHGDTQEILARIPEHIKRVPEWQCCSFWDGYLGL